ncbi:mechanosensitive ion channel family protein [Alkalihalobacillus trypoxylicola]|uniref:Mechanosensitive ion channel protein n=1 Tax=Alkalihalobacillus trypoxylicola TaxID=519424 RepID=A0A162FBY7_9BACI|nr:mechanosensitive ion channel family protein [Alkalihalobacillus trypoxylicola]KYG35248.1 mechanosensitive ion channel protein [Alkalihalobacillus trypoxylicola]GAF63895.1 small mechanosensitive channel [Bacillus sp. TS-2]
MEAWTSQWSRFLNSFSRFDWVDIGIAVLIFLIFLVFRKIFTKYVYKIILGLAKKAPVETISKVLMAFERPLRWFWVIIGTYLALLYLPFFGVTAEFVQSIYKTFIIALIGWGIFNYFSEYSNPFEKVAEKTDIDEDSMLIPFIAKLIRAAVVIITVVAILSVWEIEVGAFVAGLGVAGLAFSLAAQDTIANFFGGVVIITEKPFAKGDWIETPSVEGTVEDITFRSTEIRTFSDTIVTVPNSTLANEPITNWSKMSKRRVDFELALTYDTPNEKITKAVEGIEKMLREHSGVHPDVIMVNFTEFRESHLGIFIYFFTKTTIWSEYLKVKENTNLKILEILKENGVVIALPSRQLYVPHSDEIKVEANHNKQMKDYES